MLQLDKSRISLVIIGILLISFPLIVHSQDLLQLNIANHEEGIYRTLLKKSGKVIWQASWSVKKMVKDGKEIMKMSERGRGNYNNSSIDINWVVETRFVSQYNPFVLETKRTVFSPGNKELWRKNKIFDYSQKRLIAEHFNYEKFTKRKLVPLPEEIVFTSEILSLILRGYNFEAQEPFSFYIFSSDAKLFKMQAQKIDKEIVRVPAGKFECYKIEIFPDLGFMNYLSRHFFPKTYLWFTVKKPHFWVKYEGLESGLNSPYVVMEIIEFHG